MLGAMKGMVSEARQLSSMHVHVCECGSAQFKQLTQLLSLG